jgi:hypothetical protein
MTRQTVTLYNAQQGHKELMRLWVWCKAMLLAEHRLTIEARPEKRSDAQNRLMWSALGDCARQITWHGQKLDAEAWKDMATAALKRQRVVPGIDGGFVVLGQRTSQMTKAEMTELIEFIHCFGSHQGVQWSPTSIAQDMEQTA